MLEIQMLDGRKQSFRGYRIKRNDGRGAWLASLRPIVWSLNKEQALVFGKNTYSQAQEICRISGYYTTATLAK